MWQGLAGVAFAICLVGYNASARLVITGHDLLFRRYGLTIWRAPLVGTTMSEGSGSDIGVPGNPFLSGFIFSCGGTRRGWILRGWFTAAQIDEVRGALRPEP